MVEEWSDAFQPDLRLQPGVLIHHLAIQFGGLCIQLFCWGLVAILIRRSSRHITDKIRLRDVLSQGAEE